MPQKVFVNKGWGNMGLFNKLKNIISKKEEVLESQETNKQMEESKKEIEKIGRAHV